MRNSREPTVSVSWVLVSAARLPAAHVSDGWPLATAAAGDAIAPVGNDVGSRTGRAHHPIVAPAIADVDPVGSRSWERGRGAAVVEDSIVAGPAEDAVVARPAVEEVVALAAEDEVVANAVVEPVVAWAPGDHVGRYRSRITRDAGAGPGLHPQAKIG